MKPFWKMNKWFEFEDDFKWTMMIGLGGLWRLHLAPIREGLIYDFLKGIKCVYKMQIKAIVRGQKVKIIHEVISEMLLLPCQGPNIKWSSSLQQGIPKMCKNLVDETIIIGKKGWLVMKMKGRYI
jgi:hypothetical protein